MAKKSGDFIPEKQILKTIILVRGEKVLLKSQFATSNSNWGGRRKLPLVFTEHGALQAANVLNSPQAVKMSVFVVRTFIKLREIGLTNEKLSRKIFRIRKTC